MYKGSHEVINTFYAISLNSELRSFFQLNVLVFYPVTSLLQLMLYNLILLILAAEGFQEKKKKTNS